MLPRLWLVLLVLLLAPVAVLAAAVVGSDEYGRLSAREDPASNGHANDSQGADDSISISSQISNSDSSATADTNVNTSESRPGSAILVGTVGASNHFDIFTSNSSIMSSGFPSNSTFCPNNCSGQPCNVTSGICQCGSDPFVTPMSMVDCTAGVAYLGEARMQSYRILMGILFALCFLFTLSNVIYNVWEAGSFRMTIKNFTFVVLSLAFFVHTIYYAVDPLGVYQIYPNPLGRFLFSVFYSMFFTCYSLILLLWIEICNPKGSTISSGFISRTRPMFLGINISLYSFELILIILQSSNIPNAFVVILYSYMVYLGIMVAGCAVVAFIYGRRFMAHINHYKQERHVEYKLMAQKVTSLTWGVSASCTFTYLLFVFVTLLRSQLQDPAAYLGTDALVQLCGIFSCFIIIYTLMRTNRVAVPSSGGSASGRGPLNKSSQVEMKTNGSQILSVRATHDETLPDMDTHVSPDTSIPVTLSVLEEYREEDQQI